VNLLWVSVLTKYKNGRMAKMREKKQEVKTFMVSLYCECGSEMKSTGEAFMVNPPKYIHEYVNCDRIEKISGKTYPYIAYK